MSVPLSDTRPTSHCGSSHWSLPVRCQMPTGHGPDYHAGWTGKSGTPGRAYVRYWAETGVTEQLIAGVWQPMGIPGPRCEELLAEVDRLRAQRAAVVELHDWDELVFGGFYCMHCTMDDSLSEPVSWPCSSLRAVGMTDEEALAIITAHRVAIAKGAGQ